MSRSERARTVAARLAAVMSEDLAWGSREFILNSLGGSPLLPRVARVLLLRLMGLDVRTPDIMSRCTFVGSGHISLAEGVFINRHCYLEAIGDITLKKDSGLGTQTTLITSAHPFQDDGRHSLAAVGQPITIGERTWVAARVVVLPGVTIGDDCIIAAGAVVTADCEPGGLYAGVPARRIRDLPQGPRVASDVPEWRAQRRRNRRPAARSTATGPEAERNPAQESGPHRAQSVPRR